MPAVVVTLTVKLTLLELTPESAFCAAVLIWLVVALWLIIAYLPAVMRAFSMLDCVQKNCAKPNMANSMSMNVGAISANSTAVAPEVFLWMLS